MKKQELITEQEPEMSAEHFDKDALTRFILSKTSNGNRAELEQLANLLGISADTLDNWLDGKYPKQFGMFVALHRALLLPLESPVVKRGAN